MRLTQALPPAARRGWPARTWALVRRALAKSIEDRVPKLGAALAYYSIFSLVPLLVIVLAAAGAIYGEAAARGEVSGQISGLLGHAAGDAIQWGITATRRQHPGVVATTLSALFLFYEASVVFIDLQESLDLIWKVGPTPRGTFWRTPRNWLISVVVALAVGTLFLLSIALATGLASVDHRATDGFWLGRTMVAWSLSLALSATLFAAVLKFLPDARVPWASVWVGALTTAVLFTAGKLLLTLGLRLGMTKTAYGAAGSALVLLMWFYYSAQILYFGAELSQVHATGKRGPGTDALARLTTGT